MFKPLFCLVIVSGFCGGMLFVHEPGHQHPKGHPSLEFDLKSIKNGAWSDAKTWEPARVPRPATAC